MSFADAMRATGGDAVAAAAMVFAEAPGDKRGADESFGDTNPADPKAPRAGIIDTQEALAQTLRVYAERGSDSGVTTPRQIDTLLKDFDKEIYAIPYLAEDGKAYNIVSYFIRQADAHDVPEDRVRPMLEGLVRHGASLRNDFTALSPVETAIDTKVGLGLLKLVQMGAPISARIIDEVDAKWALETGGVHGDTWGRIADALVEPRDQLQDATRSLVKELIGLRTFKDRTRNIKRLFWRIPFRIKRSNGRRKHILEHLLENFTSADADMWQDQREYFDFIFNVVSYAISKSARVNFRGKSAAEWVLGSDNEPRLLQLLMDHGAFVTAQDLETARFLADMYRRSAKSNLKSARDHATPGMVGEEKERADEWVRQSRERMERANEMYDMVWAQRRGDALDLVARRSRLLREVPPEVQERIMQYTERASQARM